MKVRVTQSSLDGIREIAERRGLRMIDEPVPVASDAPLSQQLFEIDLDEDVVEVLLRIDPDVNRAIQMAVGGQYGHA